MIIDIVVIAVTLISAIISFFRGFIREILTIAGVVAGFFAAIFFGPKLSPIFDGWLGVNDDPETVKKLFDLIPMEMVSTTLAYAAIFIVVVIIVSIISHFVAGAAKALGLGPVDRTIGVIFGIIRGVVLLALFYLPFHFVMDQESKTEYFASSKTHYYIEKTAQIIAGYLPETEKLEKAIDEQAEETIKDKLMENNFLENKDQKPANAKPAKKETGYDEDEREELENLFERPALVE